MPQVEIYCSNFCIYCTMALQLLDRKGVNYKKLDIDGNNELRSEMQERSRRHTVPQIFIGDTHVGGYDDMAALEASGRLNDLLELSEEA